MSMHVFLDNIRTKSIHIVGVSGAEGSNILRFLMKNGMRNITTHDYVDSQDVKKNFRMWHKGISSAKREEVLKQFVNDLSQTQFHDRKNYLKDVANADIIFVPQSWRLYEEQNHLLWEAKRKGILFYSLTRLYLDFAKANIIGISGTVGKGSVANLLSQFIEKLGKKVYFAGNDTWMPQLLDRMDEMRRDDYLVLEISHRQLLDGFTKAPHMVVITNLYPNHLDEVTWEQYVQVKLSLTKKQNKDDISVLNFDSDVLIDISKNLRSKVYFFSEKNKNMNTKNVQNLYAKILSIKSSHYPSNILIALTIIDLLNISTSEALNTLMTIPSLPARMEYIGDLFGRLIYDDIKSTSPWATIAAVERLAPNTILICGGDTKGIDYRLFVHRINGKVKKLIILSSKLSSALASLLDKSTYKVVNSLEAAVQMALKESAQGDKILISPAAGFFYSLFIKNKKSIRRIISLLQAEQT